MNADQEAGYPAAGKVANRRPRFQPIAHAGRSVAGFFYSSVNLATEAMLQIEGVEGFK